MISFKANVISYPKIDILGKDKKYHKQEVAFLELDCNMDSDVYCIKEASKKWKYGNTFANDIAASMDTINKKIRLYDYYDWDKEKRFFALTKQTNGFLDLNPHKIIGVAEIDKEYDYPYNELEFLQVKPTLKRKRSNKPRKIKNIGRVLVNSILKVFNNKTLVVEPTKKAIPFYSKLGFKNCREIKFPGFITEKTMVHLRKAKI